MRLPGFTGLYNTAIGEILDGSLERESEEIAGEDGHELFIFLDNARSLVDWQKVHLHTSQVCVEEFAAHSCAAAAGLANVKFSRVDSPNFYNYRTDEVEISVDVDLKKAGAWLLRELANREVMDKVLERHTSCEGFVSFISNAASDWLRVAKTMADGILPPSFCAGDQSSPDAGIILHEVLDVVAGDLRDAYFRAVQCHESAGHYDRFMPDADDIRAALGNTR